MNINVFDVQHTQYHAAPCISWVASHRQHTATHCNKLQHTANTATRQLHKEAPRRPHTAKHCNTLHHITTHCNTLQQTTTVEFHKGAHREHNTLRRTTTHWNTLQHTAAHRKHCINWNTLQHVALHILPQAEAQRNTLLHATLDEFYKGAQRGTTLWPTTTHCNTL